MELIVVLCVFGIFGAVVLAEIGFLFVMAGMVALLLVLKALFPASFPEGQEEDSVARSEVADS